MKRLRKTTSLLVGIATLNFTLGALMPSAGASATTRPGYVALGDSIDFGIGDPDGIGYVPPFGVFALGPSVEIHNLSQPGAETRDILLNQLVPAIAEIQNHRPFGVVVSLGGGGNDLLHFIASPQAATCLKIVSCLARINALLNEAEQTIDLIAKALRVVAGPESPFLLRTQYNALAKTSCATNDQVALADAALEGAPGTLLTQGLNDRIRRVGARHGAKVVEIFLAFRANPDLLIAGDCVHPNDLGYEVILDAFKLAFLAP